MLPCFSSQEITLSSARGMLHQSNITSPCHDKTLCRRSFEISNVGGCQLREKLARGGNWAMFRLRVSYISFQKLYTNTGPFRHAYYAVTPSHVESGRFNKNDHAWSSFVFLLQPMPCWLHELIVN